jgi:uncharacterized protein YcfL
MTIKKKIISLTITLFMICACSTTPPIVVHNEYDEMLADNELFRKEARECALQAKEGVSSATLTQNSEKHEVVTGGIQLFSFFSENASCIKLKGWRIKE